MKRRAQAGRLLTVVALLAAPPVGAVTYRTTIADGNLVGVTLTNYGALGNSFINRSASLEYPLGTGYEHLVHGGLWIGARATDGAGAFTGVTTAMLDASVGTSTAPKTEFTPSGDTILRRSSSLASPDYSPDAVSALDVIGLFDDATVKTADFNNEVHRPLGVAVRQVSHQWGQAERVDFAIQRFVIRNTGTSALTDVHVGLYTELASGPKNDYALWPPTSSSSIHGTWYGRKLLAWDGPPRLLREHRCTHAFNGCQFEITPAWMGVKLLTAPTAGQQVTVGVWEYEPGDPARDQDAERYAILSAGTIADVTALQFLPGVGDPVELLALGPFASIAPGDSLEVAFALVGGADEAAILAHAAVAQEVYDNGPLVAVGDAPGVGRLHLAPVTNPLSRGACSVRFELPAGAGASRLDVVDAAGRRIATRDLGAPGAGRHGARLDELATAVPGIYFLRLTSGAEVAKSRIVVLP